MMQQSKKPFTREAYEPSRKSGTMLGVIPALIQDDPEFSELPPLVLIHDGGGTTINYYYLEDVQRHVWGISNELLVDETAWPGGINQMAQTYLDLIRSELGEAPMILGGWSHCFRNGENCR